MLGQRPEAMDRGDLDTARLYLDEAARAWDRVLGRETATATSVAMDTEGAPGTCKHDRRRGVRRQGAVHGDGQPFAPSLMCDVCQDPDRWCEDHQVTDRRAASRRRVPMHCEWCHGPRSTAAEPAAVPRHARCTADTLCADEAPPIDPHPAHLSRLAEELGRREDAAYMEMGGDGCEEVHAGHDGSTSVAMHPIDPDVVYLYGLRRLLESKGMTRDGQLLRALAGRLHGMLGGGAL